MYIQMEKFEELPHVLADYVLGEFRRFASTTSNFVKIGSHLTLLVDGGSNVLPFLMIVRDAIISEDKSKSSLRGETIDPILKFAALRCISLMTRLLKMYPALIDDEATVLEALCSLCRRYPDKNLLDCIFVFIEQIQPTHLVCF